MKILITISAIALVVLLALVSLGWLIYGRSPTPPTPSNLLEKTQSLLDEQVLLGDIGQMLMVGFRGASILDSEHSISDSVNNVSDILNNLSDSTYIVDIINDLAIGGAIFFDYDLPSKSFPRNIINPSQTKQLIIDLQSISEIPLFIAVDAEGGNINRLKPKYGFVDIVSAKEIGNASSTEFAKQQASKMAVQLKNLGFNMNFAPVIDVDVNPNNPVIGGLGRAFSQNPEKVTQFAQIFIEEQRKSSIISVVKHFPGHGSSKGDSHLGLTDITETYQAMELEPYQKLQEQGMIDAVMTAHIINKEIDKENPATLSPLFINDILRQKIGFNGVVISDDMQMKAIADQYSLRESIIKAINAGCDIILLSNNTFVGYNEDLPYEVKDIIHEAVLNGEISRGKIAESAKRIRDLKKRFDLINITN